MAESYTVHLAAGPDDVAACYAVRHEVFVIGQAVPVEIERDELDEAADHAVAVDADGAVVGTGRLVSRPDRVGVVGRMAVLPAVRGRGVGAAVLGRLEAAAAERGLVTVELHAQRHAEGFYARLGYAAYGEPFDEAGIEHVHMRKALPRG